MGKIKVLVVPSDNIGGVGFYRSTQPHVYLAEKYPEEFDVTINMKPNFKDLQSFDKYDIVHIHKGLFDDMNSFYAFLALCVQAKMKQVRRRKTEAQACPV